MIEYPCGVAHVDGSSCGLEMGHEPLHEFTVPPPEEYFEDDECSQNQQQERVYKMAELEVKGGPDTGATVAALTPSAAAAKGKTVTLTFSTPEELTLFAALEADAAEDERSLSKYLVRLLKSSGK